MGFFAALTPGPDIFYVIRQGLCKGNTSAFLAVAGILSGNIVYLTLVGIGLGSIGHNPYFQMSVGIAGGVYLLRIAFAVFKEKVRIEKSCGSLKKFDVYKEGKKVKNPQTNMTISLPGKKIATIRIEATMGDTPDTEVSLATITDGNLTPYIESKDYSKIYIQIGDK